MYKIIDKLTVAIRKSDGVGYAISNEKTHTKAYQTSENKIINWSGKDGKLIHIDNVPVKGFSLSKIFDRYSYFGNSKNVIFRVRDPRGFELELYQESFARLICDITIIKGEIQEECYWSKHNSDWALIPVGSETDKQHEREKEVHLIKPMGKAEIRKIPIGSLIKVKERNEVIDMYFFGYHKLVDISMNRIGRGYGRSYTVFETTKPKIVERMIVSSRYGNEFDDFKGIEIAPTTIQIIGYDDTQKSPITDKFTTWIGRGTAINGIFNNTKTSNMLTHSYSMCDFKVDKIESSSMGYESNKLIDIVKSFINSNNKIYSVIVNGNYSLKLSKSDFGKITCTIQSSIDHVFNEGFKSHIQFRDFAKYSVDNFVENKIVANINTITTNYNGIIKSNIFDIDTDLDFICDSIDMMIVNFINIQKYSKQSHITRKDLEYSVFYYKINEHKAYGHIFWSLS